MKSESPPALARWLAQRCLSRSDAARLLDALDEEYAELAGTGASSARAGRWYWSQILRSIPPMARRGRITRSREGSAAVRRKNGAPVRRGLLLDLRHLVRMLRRTPWSAGSAVLTLALTLGLGTAIFAVVDTVLLRPLPYADPEALVVVGPVPTDEPEALPRAVRLSDLETWRDALPSPVRLEGYEPSNETLTGLGAAQRVSVTEVTTGFFDLLGVVPALGRGLGPDELGQAVVVVSHDFWRTRLAADPGTLGEPIELNGRRHTVVGVLPQDFFFPLNFSSVWRPLSRPVELEDRNDLTVRVVGRTPGDAATESMLERLKGETPQLASGLMLRAAPLSDIATGGGRLILGLLAGAATLAILVAFSNLAVLLIVRSIDRGRELAVRSALGAGPWETLRQLQLEALALAVLGIAGGVALAVRITPVLSRFALEFGGLSSQSVGVSWRAVGIVTAVALTLAALCAGYPALGALRRGAKDNLRRGTAASPRQLSARRVFVASQVAVAFVLLVSLAQVGRSLLNVLDLGTGFEPAGVLKLQVSLPPSSHEGSEEVASFYAEVQRQLDARLGTGASALVSEVPLTGDGGRGPVGPRRGEATEEAVFRSASAGYFELMGIPLLRGRTFDATDLSSAPQRVVVTESLARRLAGSDRIVGSSIWLPREDRVAEVVGVVGDVKHRALEEPVTGTVYLSAEQSPSRAGVVVVRSSLPEAAVVSTVNETVQRLDRSVPVYRVQTMADVVAQSPGVAARRILTAAFGGSALLAVLLSTIGLFGVLAHDVANRGREVAVRMALGATPQRILAATIRRGARLVAIGLLLGALGSVAAVRGLRAILFSTQQGDWASASLISALILAVAGIAAILPVALRAARREPSTALRGS